MKHNFKNDYSNGAHPKLLAAINNSNESIANGYGEDIFCTEAKKNIHKHLKNAASKIHFVSGGTQANLIAISAILQKYESVIAAETGHISVHETGAIEATGHKINAVKTTNGKLTPHNILPILEAHHSEHMVSPKLVFISNATEIGNIYNKSELTELYNFCQEKNLYLYIDGARLGSALSSKNNDLALSDLAKLCDIFYIGGTKNGALIGEALVINNPKIQKNFRFHLKQKGALLAKGRLLGCQFQALFSKNLYFEIGADANKKSEIITQALLQKNISFLAPPESNQIFPILPNKWIELLQKNHDFYVWEKITPTESAIRIICSWDTPIESIQALTIDIKKLS